MLIYLVAVFTLSAISLFREIISKSLYTGVSSVEKVSYFCYWLVYILLNESSKWSVRLCVRPCMLVLISFPMFIETIMVLWCAQFRVFLLALWMSLALHPQCHLCGIRQLIPMAFCVTTRWHFAAHFTHYVICSTYHISSNYFQSSFLELAYIVTSWIITIIWQYCLTKC